MESRVKLFGHPIHPVLIVYPVGLLSTAVIFDLLYVLTGNVDLSTFSFWALLAGLIGGLAAAIFGLIDWMAVPKGTRARRIGAFHGAGNVVVVVLFAASLGARWSQPAYLPDTMPFVFGIMGLALALVTAWLGGELVYRLRVAVDEGANLDAPSSLTSHGPVDLEA